LARRSGVGIRADAEAALDEILGTALLCSLRRFLEALRSQRQHPLEARYASALLGLLVLWQAGQQRLGGGLRCPHPALQELTSVEGSNHALIRGQPRF
jgi:hypothetical protein